MANPFTVLRKRGRNAKLVGKEGGGVPKRWHPIRKRPWDRCRLEVSTRARDPIEQESERKHSQESSKPRCFEDHNGTQQKTKARTQREVGLKRNITRKNEEISGCFPKFVKKNGAGRNRIRTGRSSPAWEFKRHLIFRHLDWGGGRCLFERVTEDNLEKKQGGTPAEERLNGVQLECKARCGHTNFRKQPCGRSRIQPKILAKRVTLEALLLAPHGLPQKSYEP